MAIQRPLDMVQTLGKGRVLLGCTLLGTGGATAPSVEKGDMGFVVTRAAAGDYTIKLPGRGALTILSVAPVAYIGTNQKRTWIAAVDHTARTIQVKLVDVSTAAGAASELGATERLSLTVLVKNTSASGSR